MQRLSVLAALAASHSITPANHSPDEYEPYDIDPGAPHGIGDVDDYDAELEDLLDESDDDDDHLGGPGDRLLNKIQKLQAKEQRFIAEANSSTGGRRRRALNKLERVRKSLGRRRTKLAAKLAKWVARGKLSNADAARMASQARMPWTPIDDGTDLSPSGTYDSPTAMTRPDGSSPTAMTRPDGVVPTPYQPGAVMQNQTPLANGTTQWGGTNYEPVRTNAGPVQVVNTTELVKGPGVETPIMMNKAGASTEWIDAAWAIGTGGRVEWKAELPLISYAAFEVIGVKIETVVIGRAADTALAGTVDGVAPDGSNNLLIGKRSFSFDEGVITTIDSLRRVGRIDPNQKATVSGYVEQLGANAAALSVKFRVSLITRVAADRG